MKTFREDGRSSSADENQKKSALEQIHVIIERKITLQHQHWNENLDVVNG